MADSGKFMRVCILVAGLLVGAGTSGWATEASGAAPSRTMVQKATWVETMLATRAEVGPWLAAQERDLAQLKLGPWYATGPLKGKDFGTALFPEKRVDLAAKNKKGEPVWRKHADWKDGVVIRLQRRANSASTYLFRTITVPRDLTVTAHFGSDDGLGVWLNGEQLIANDVPRGVGPNQDKADLCLKAGENRLLLKIYNRTGDHGFYFSIRKGLSLGLWRQIERAFPTEAGWMRRDAPRGGHVAWFRSTGKVDVETAMIDRALRDVGPGGENLRKELDGLRKAKVASDDPRWLTLYVQACRFRQGLADLKGIDLGPIRLVVQDLAKTFPKAYRDGAKYLARVDECEKRLAALRQALSRGDVAAAAQVPAFAEAVVSLRCEVLLANPLLDFDKLLLVKRRADRHGLPQNWQGNCAIPRTGYDNEIATLSPVSPKGTLSTFLKPKGTRFIGDVDLHFDADRMLFSMPGTHGRWQIWEVKADGTGLRQVTPGEHPDVDNYDACYLPDGRIIFGSTRCFQGIPCVGGSNTVANLCIMDADGGNIRQLCFDQDHNWCPTVLNNGRVIYSRWEYADTPHYFDRLLFHMNPDGTEQMEYYGSNSYWPNSTFYARPIPGHPTRVVAIISGHHGVPRMGELMIFDPAKGRHEADGVVQRIPGYRKPVEPLIRDQLVNASWPRFLHPYPLGGPDGRGAGKYFLVSCQPTPASSWGVYLVDVFDNMLLLKDVPGYALFEPVPFRKTATPPVIPDKVKLDRRDAVVYLADVYFGDGLKDVPRGTVKRLRVIEFHYAYPKMGGHIHVGVEGAWDVHRILGTVPVFEDGSAVFRVPANTPIAVQPLDGEGKAVQLMRSWFTAMPGEVLSCVGCHEHQNATPPIRQTLAATHTPSDIDPWYGPARGFSFKREVQPVLDKYCVGCHDGHERPGGKRMLDLRAKDKNGWSNFTPSYLALHPYVRRPGPESDYHLPNPMEWHVGTSELMQMMAKGHHGVKLDPEALDRLITWIDLNVPDHGTWHEHRKIPANFHQRRLEMRTRYANRPEDPEAIPVIKRPPVQPVQPEPWPAVDAAKAKVDCPGWPFDAAEAKRRQAAVATPCRRSIDLGDGVKMDLALIPSGEFVMGDLKGPSDQLPLTRVKIDRPFWMGTLEVTCRQFACFDPKHDNGFFDQHHKDHTTPGYPAHGPDLPVIRVTWQEAMAFCRWLSAKTEQSFTLPTEAQWEWACRAGTSSTLYYGDLDSDFSRHANLADVSMKLLAVTGVNPHPIPNPNPYQDFLPKDARFNDQAKLMTEVGKYQPNAWGLHDMHGNVAEWTRTTFGPYPYSEDDGRNDLSNLGEKVVRGGSWRDRPKRARSAFRLPYRTYQRVFNVGFRVVSPVR